MYTGMPHAKSTHVRKVMTSYDKVDLRIRLSPPNISQAHGCVPPTFLPVLLPLFGPFLDHALNGCEAPVFPEQLHKLCSLADTCVLNVQVFR